MGCLRGIISLIVFAFALIGFWNSGGLNILTNGINELNNFLSPSVEKTLQQSRDIADFSKVSKNFKIERKVDILGVKAVIASDIKNQQKMIVANSGWALNLTKNDINSNQIDERIKDTVAKFANQPIKINNIEIKEKSSFKIGNQSVPYAKLKIALTGMPYKDIEGMVGVVDVAQNKQKLLISFNESGKYNESKAENFFKGLKF